MPHKEVTMIIRDSQDHTDINYTFEKCFNIGKIFELESGRYMVLAVPDAFVSLKGGITVPAFVVPEGQWLLLGRATQVEVPLYMDLFEAMREHGIKIQDKIILKDTVSLPLAEKM